MSAPPRPAISMYVAANWNNPDVARSWLQVQSGYFVPPVSGLYLFSAFCRSDAYGEAWVILSSSEDPGGAYFATASVGCRDLEPRRSREIETLAASVCRCRFRTL